MKTYRIVEVLLPPIEGEVDAILPIVPAVGEVFDEDALLAFKDFVADQGFTVRTKEHGQLPYNPDAEVELTITIGL